MIVNTASKCGNTITTKDLEATYKEYKDKGFVIVGFPANTCRLRSQELPKKLLLLSKKLRCYFFQWWIKSSKGDDMAFINFDSKSKNGLQDSKVEWNFQYLINEKGELEKWFRSNINYWSRSNWIGLRACNLMKISFFVEVLYKFSFFISTLIFTLFILNFFIWKSQLQQLHNSEYFVLFNLLSKPYVD
jgi:glutathione peroxidase-family protein